MTIDWKKYVDKIYCIQYIFNKDRTEKLNTELFRVDILQSGIYKVIEQFPSPLYDILFKHFNDISNGEDPKRYFNSFIGHYSAIKKAYLNNCNNVLILEDDCRFLKDKSQIIYLLDNALPKFIDIIDKPAIFGGSISHSINQIDAGINYDSDNLYTITEFNNRDFYYGAGAAFTIYNRKAMESLINFVENLNYAIIDQYNIIYPPETQYILLNKHICLQQDWLFMMYNTCNDYNMLQPSDEELEQKKNWGAPFNRDTNKIYNDIKKYFHMN